METSADAAAPDELRSEYDFRALRGVVRGRYAGRDSIPPDRRLNWTASRTPLGAHMPTLQQLGIDRMTVAERLALAQEILDTVAAEQPRPPLSEAKRQELDRRLTDAIANPDDGIPWEQVEAAAMARFGK